MGSDQEISSAKVARWGAIFERDIFERDTFEADVVFGRVAVCILDKCFHILFPRPQVGKADIGAQSLQGRVAERLIIKAPTNGICYLKP